MRRPTSSDFGDVLVFVGFYSILCGLVRQAGCNLRVERVLILIPHSSSGPA
ncbi:MAG: hypothetical protein ACR2OA_04510 [Rubripirellula sp.]